MFVKCFENFENDNKHIVEKKNNLVLSSLVTLAPVSKLIFDRYIRHMNDVFHCNCDTWMMEGL